MTSWDATAASRVGGWQEQAYGALAEELGLGWQPKRAFERLAVGPLPETWTSPERFRQQVGVPFDPAALAASTAEYRHAYLASAPPTPFEEPNLFGVLCELKNVAATAFADTGLPTPDALIATLPSGRVHALTRRTGGARPPVILVEQGLMHFFFRFCCCMGAAIHVEVSAAGVRPVDPGMLSQLRALDGLRGALYAYAVDGNVQRIPSLELSQGGLVSAMLFLRPMELFVVAHEMMHVGFGHLRKGRDAPSTEARWEQELDCDSAGASLTLRVLDAHPAGAVLAACDLALIAFEFIERTLSLLRTGSGDRQAVEYPPIAQRRRQLVDRTLESLTEAGRQSEIPEIRNWLHLTDTMCSALWEELEPTWRDLHRSGRRPSPRWDTTIT